MSEDIREVEKQQIKTYPTRVQLLSQDLWETTEQPNRINLLIQLADAVTTLLHLESNACAREEAEQHRAMLNQAGRSAQSQLNS